MESPRRPHDDSFQPHNCFVKALLTDMYQLTMAYAYWRSERHTEPAVFEVFFRKHPFKGEFTLFAGLEEVLRYVSSFSFSEADMVYLRGAFPPDTDPKFFEWLEHIDTKDILIYAMPEGSVVFPRCPLLRIEGPLAVAQLLETAILNLTNFASLMATNAQRMRLAAGADKTLLEFGLRRSQGPDGAISAARYAFVGGFDGTSNCLAAKLFGMTAKGTHAHAFVSSFHGPEDLASPLLDGKDLWAAVLAQRAELGPAFLNTNTSELVAFVAYAQAFPNGFLALVDTYDTLQSGVLNFICVALVLRAFGKTPVGIRLDSGDLAYLSKQARALFAQHGLGGEDVQPKVVIVASNDINEDVLHSLAKQGHEVDTFGIGTNLVTCQAQPALGMVYKLVECKGRPCVKLSDEYEKTTLPGRKKVYRLFGKSKEALADVMQHFDEPAPQAGQALRCHHPFVERKRCDVRPTEVLELLRLVMQNGKVTCSLPTVRELRDFAATQVRVLREDHIRSLNPTAYKVSLSESYSAFCKELWGASMPIELIE